VSEVWSILAPTLYARYCGSSFVLAGCLYAAGGWQSPSRFDVERYDVASDTWTAVADLRQGRFSFGAVTIRCSNMAGEQDLFDSLIAKASSMARL
jgi:hypothetical protein